MASYLPPTEDVPIFDNSNFKQNLATLTYNDATKGFLTFPFAQGNETFQDITVEGTTDLINVAQAHYTMPPTNDASLIIPSTTWVQSAIANAPSNTDINVTTATTAGPYYMPMITGSTTGAYTGYVDNGMSYDATTNNLSTTTFTGALVGNSSSATQVAITPNGNNATHYLTFSDTNTASNISLHTNAGILVNPSTDTITATTFSGALTGTSTTANNINLTTDNTAGTYYIPFSKTTTTSNTMYIDNSVGPLSYNPSISALTATTFVGALSGTATNTNNVLTGTSNTATINLVGGVTNALTYQQLFMASTLPLTYYTLNGSLGCPIMNATTSISAPSLKTTNGGSITIPEISGTYQTVISQNNVNLQIATAVGSSMNIFNNGGTCPLPTSSASFGTGIGNNISGGRAESCLVNYQGNAGVANSGGFDFYNVSSTSGAVKIAGIPKTQSAFSSTGLNIPTYDWVNGTIGAGISAITQVPVTNTTSSINYFLPLVVSSSTGLKTLFAGGSVAFNPAINTLSTTNFSASGNMQAPLIQTTANGIIRTYDTGGVLATSFQQSGTDLNITIPATGEMKITTQGTGVIPTSNADAGTSFLWNVSAGGGESCIVNYQDGGNAGGFDFYNVNGVANSVKIATIPKTQSPNGTASTTILPTYTWVNGTISDAISAIPALNSFNMTAINPVASNTYYGLWANSATTGSHPINNGTYVQLVPNTNTMSISSNLNILNTQTSLNNVRMTSTPIILAFGNSDGSAGGGADAVNLTSSYISSTGWTNPSAGLYTITLTGVAHSIFSATITGNPGTSTAGQRPQILTSVAYAGGFTNAYLSVTFQIYYLQGTGGAGAPFNGPFSYSISGIMN